MADCLDSTIDAFDFEARMPSWLVDGDIQASILDTPLVNVMAELAPAWPQSLYAAYGTTNYRSPPDTRSLWFTAGDDTHKDVPLSGSATPPATRVEVDDTCRQCLHQSLQIRPQHDQTLPSADFLNLCVRSYFSRFRPVFPVVHVLLAHIRGMFTMVQKKIEALPLGCEAAAIHVPRAMFRAGVAWFCYTRFGDAVTRRTVPVTSEGLDFPEFKLLGINVALLLFQANGYKHGRPTTTEANGALCALTDLFRRSGHWEIARKFAAITWSFVA